MAHRLLLGLEPGRFAIASDRQLSQEGNPRRSPPGGVGLLLLLSARYRAGRLGSSFPGKPIRRPPRLTLAGPLSVFGPGRSPARRGCLQGIPWPPLGSRGDRWSDSRRLPCRRSLSHPQGMPTKHGGQALTQNRQRNPALGAGHSGDPWGSYSATRKTRHFVDRQRLRRQDSRVNAWGENIPK